MNLNNFNQESALIGYDVEHAKFRKEIYTAFIKREERKFINRFIFEGDVRFTKQKQRLFLGFLFRYGAAGVVNLKKLKYDKIMETINKTAYMQNWNINVDEEFNKVISDELIPVIVFPNLRDNDNMIISGVGVSTPLSNYNKFASQITRKDSAIAQLYENLESGYSEWHIYAYIYATALTAIQKKILLADTKIISNNVSNTYNNGIAKQVFKMDEPVISISASQESMLNAFNKSNNVNASVLFGVDDKIQKLDMSNGETIGNLMESLDKLGNQIYKLMGERANVSVKKERSINKDFTSDEMNFALLEADWNSKLEIFIEEYKNVFGIQLTMIDKKVEIANEINNNIAKEDLKVGNNE